MPRERLFARLDGMAGRTVAWISGPPGSGKTSLAASYLEARRFKVLWYQIDAGELAEFATVRGHVLAAEAASQLHERTQGWAAGIVLMLEHAKLAGRMAELPDDAPPKAIFDYLAGEIFNHFEPKTQQFLMRIACLPRMTAAVAESLSGEPKAARLLLNLALNDYFVAEVCSEEGRVYELHPLLRDFLRSRAAQELPEAMSLGEQKRAAELLRAAGHVEDAVSLLIDCASWPEVAAIAGEQAQTMLAQGRSEALGRWLELLPAELVERDPRLLHALGAYRSHSSPRAARRYFERAFEGFRHAQNAEGML